MRVQYEWVIEYSDEWGDIIDLDHADPGDLHDLLDRHENSRNPELQREFAVQRIEWTPAGGEEWREYAYFKEGVLPDHCDNGVKVAAFITKEAERNAERVRQLTDMLPMRSM